MQLISRNLHLLKTTEQLAERWVKRRGADIAPDELASRLRKRCETIRRFVEINSPQPLDTVRLWETTWSTEQAEARLRGAFRRLDWDVLAARTTDLPPQALAGPTTQRNTAVIDPRAAENLHQRFLEAGILVKLTQKDVLLYLMAEELYAIASEEMGRKPARPEVEELAPPLFASEVLAWPFSRWSLDFI